MSKFEVIRLSLLNCMNRIYMLDGNMFVKDMHMFDADELISAEFYKMFKLIDLSCKLNNFETEEFTSCSSKYSHTRNILPLASMM